jgi:hypothetical protein
VQGYSSGRLIARLETVGNLLQLHSCDALPKIPPKGPTARLRTVLYAFPRISAPIVLYRPVC